MIANNTHIKFTVKTDILNLFSKKLYSLAKRDRHSVLTFIAHETFLQILFKTTVDSAGTEGHFEYLIEDVEIDTVGVTTVYAAELADVLSKFPYYRSPDKPFTRDLTFVGDTSEVKIKTILYWTEDSDPTAQQLAISTLKSDINIESTPLFKDDLSCSTVVFNNEDLISAIDMCSFIKGDATSKDEFGYKFFVEEGKVVVLATDLTMASRYVLLPVEIEESYSLDSIIGSQVLGSIRTFVTGVEPVIMKTSHNLLHIKCGNRRMVVPTLKREFPISSELFFQPSRKLGTVSIDALDHIISHFLLIDKDPYHKTKFIFDKESKKFKINAGEKGENNVDNLPSTVCDSGEFIIDASYIHTILSRLKKVGEVCDVMVDIDTAERITLVSDGTETRYLVQGLNMSYE